MSASVTVVLADDHPAFLLGVRLGLEAEGVEVLATAADGAAAIAACQRLRPDAAVLDVRMPGVDGMRAMRAIHGDAPEVALIVLSTFDDAATRREARDAGARAFLTKDVPIDALAETIVRLVREPGLHLVEVPELPALTPRELEVLRLLADGASNKRIAVALDIAVDTVKEHCSAVYGKLGVTGRVQAIALARGFGLVG
jgi:DNA-binding NarL/FixJ family response regulator